MKVRVVLIRHWPIDGEIRHPGHVLLEGIVPQGLTTAKVLKAIRQGAADLVPIKEHDSAVHVPPTVAGLGAAKRVKKGRK